MGPIYTVDEELHFLIANIVKEWKMNYYIVKYEFGQYIQVGGSNSAVHTDVLPVVLFNKTLDTRSLSLPS